MARKGENLYKRKDGRWEGRYKSADTISGKPKYKSVYGKTYTEAKNKLAEAKGRENAGCPERILSIGRRKVSTLAEEWMTYMESRIKQSTYAKYRNIVEHRLNPYFGEFMLKEISSRMIVQYADKMLLSGDSPNQKLSTKTVAGYIQVLTSILQFAETRYSFPCCSVEPLRLPKEHKALRIFNMDEQAALTDYLLKSDDRKDLGVLLALYTGLRIGEVCAMQGADICLASKILSVRKSVQRVQNKDSGCDKKTNLLIEAPKSLCSIRDIPIPEFLIAKLAPYIQTPESYILSGDTTRIIEPRNEQYHFKRILKNVGIENINFHACRHTFATRCVEQGFDVKSLSEILGHSTVKITLDKYVHPTMQLKRDNMEKLSGLFAVK